MRSIIKQIQKLRYKGKPLKFIFSEFHRKNIWRGKDSLSGAGSDLIQTSRIRKEIPSLLERINAKSLLDAPCGDFYWMRNTKLGSVQYIGIDTVPDLIDQNQRQYGNEMRKFINLDISEDKLPYADVILCRDCLVHFSFKHIVSAIKKFKESGSKYLLTTTFINRSKNKDIITSRWRPINLQLSPFNFPKPIELICEQCTEANDKYSDKSLGLWKLEDILI